MTSWEPYPMAKMTRAQEQAYAENQHLQQQQRIAAKKKATGRSSTTGKKKRIVRTAAGARRYKVPIGSEIGTARNAQAAKAQRDTESTNRYRSLVGGNEKAQRAALGKLSDWRLQRLSRVAYSFRSSDPNVVRLRIGVANELARRGMNVNDFGGLGPKSRKGPAPARRAPAKRTRKPVRKAKKKPARKAPVRSAMTARQNDRRLRELSVPQLRAAVRVFPKIPVGKRQAVARVLVRRALELGAPHFLGESVIEAAALPDETRTKVIELAGRWKHGFIPLDAAALESKMKGRTGGKRWWSEPGGRGGTKGRLHSAVGVPKSRSQTYGRGRIAGEQERNQPLRNRLQENRNQVGGTKVVNSGQAPAFKAQKRNKPSLGTQHKTADRFQIGNDGYSEARKQKDGTFSIYHKGRKSRRPEDNNLTREQAAKLSGEIHKQAAASKYQKAVGITAPIGSPRRRDYESRREAQGQPRTDAGYKPGISPGAAGWRPRSVADLPETAHPSLREALEDGMDVSAVHRSNSGSYAVDNGDGSWSAFDSKGRLIDDDARPSQFPADSWPTIKAGRSRSRSAKRKADPVGSDRTSVVKSGSNREGGSKMNRNQMLDELSELQKKKNKTATDRTRMAKLRQMIDKRSAQIDAKPKSGSALVSSYGKIPHPGKA